MEVRFVLGCNSASFSRQGRGKAAKAGVASVRSVLQSSMCANALLLRRSADA